MANSLLQNALMLDTETLGLRRGSGMHELAVFNLETGAMNEFLLTPNMVQVAANTAQETTRLATSSLDIAKLVEAPSWMSIVRQTLKMDNPRIGALKSQEQVLKALNVAQPWLAKSLDNYPHLLGKVESASEKDARLKNLVRHGVTNFSSQTVTSADLFKQGGHLENLISGGGAGRTLWGANMAFDAKQIGAIAMGLEEQGVPNALKSVLQTSGTTQDPYYTTGVEFNKAKVTAQQTGDWTGVWRAMLTDTPQAGEVAVRDIQDVLRSMMSYGQKLGLASGSDVYWGTGLDTQYRLMGSLEGGDAGIAKLSSKETHRAAEDLAVHSKYVLERAVRYTSALQEVHEDTALGRKLRKQALEQKSGDFFEASTLLHRQEMLKPDLLEDSLVKRLARAQQDLIEQGSTWQVDGWRSVQQLTQQTPAGLEVQVPVLQPNRVAMNNLEDVVGLLRAQGKYEGFDIGAYAAEVSQAVAPGRDVEHRKQLLTDFLEAKTSGKLEARIAAKSKDIMAGYNLNLSKIVTKKAASAVLGNAANTFAGHAKNLGPVATWGAFAAATASAGLMYSVASGGPEERENPSLVTYSYNQWLEQQAKWSDSRSLSEQNEGMSERGLAGTTRRKVTDFGSPYQGIMGSQIVFQNQTLLQEREKWLREQYGVVHFDPMDGIFGMNGVFSKARHSGYSYLPGAEQVTPNYGGLRGQHLMKVNLGTGDWKMTAEDADTILLQRGGIRGRIASLFGMNKGYSFRLAGVDSPEIEHGQTFGAQPHAYQSMQALQQMLGNGSGAELVFDPGQTTYGRTMGVVFQRSKNVNYELVKRGWAGFLPFGKSSDSMIDYQVMRGMEEGARGGQRGMWQHPYWQAMYDVTKGRDRPTFNTLTKADKIVESKSNMDMVSLMQQAQDQGMYSSAAAIEASRIGKFRHRGVDSVKPVVVTGNTASHYDGYLQDMLRDTANFTKTHGSRRSDSAGAFSSRSGYRNFDKAMVLDSMGHTNSVWSRRRLAAFDKYGTGDQQAADRKGRMMMAQQQVNANIFNSLQNHSNFQLGG